LLEPQDAGIKGLGTNPTGSAEWCTSSATISGYHRIQGCHERRGKERSQKVSRHRTAGHGPVTNRIPTQCSREGMAGVSPDHTAPPPPPPPARGGGGRGRHGLGSETTPRGNKGYVIHSGVLLSGPLSQGLTYVNRLVVSLGA
jgi:hypothetical protein